MSNTIALIVAGGRGVRAGGGIPKQYRLLGGLPILRRSIMPFLNHRKVAAVRVVIHPDDHEVYASATEGLELLSPVHGGNTRQQSARNGLESLRDLAPDTVLIHDAARPFVSQETIGRVIDALSADRPAAIAALPVTDTLKRANRNLAITETVDRENLWRAQTPQGFRYADILAAHEAVSGQDLTDDASVAEAAGLAVKVVEGDANNFKVTEAEDFARGEMLLNSGSGEYRNGSGFDVHPFEDGDHVMLCGVKIPYQQGLAGHSDSDVGLHALTDALLGTVCAGDIGSHFPPGDPQWAGADSSVFLEQAAALVRNGGGAIRHVDLTLICEAPKIGPHREEMRHRLAQILGIEIHRVSVKATTTDGLGFLGRGEGIAAQASATVYFPAGAAPL